MNKVLQNIFLVLVLVTMTPSFAQETMSDSIPNVQKKERIESRQELDQSFFDWVGSSKATAISFVLNIIMFFLTLFGFYLYYAQKREYKLLTAIMQDFGLKEK